MFKKIILFSFYFVVALVTFACNNNSNVDASISKNAINTTITVLERIDLKIGEGATARKGNKVAVHYSGWLYDNDADNKKGKLFDTSSDLGEPLIFVLGQKTVIQGWDEGIVGMNVGGKRRLIIPSELAYGSKRLGTARTAIPKNSVLVFDVELIDAM